MALSELITAHRGPSSGFSNSFSNLTTEADVPLAFLLGFYPLPCPGLDYLSTEETRDIAAKMRHMINSFVSS